MKRTYLKLLLLLFSFPALSQTIRGRLTDSLNIPVPFATVSLLNSADSSIVSGLITEDNGTFSFNQKPGNYLVKVTAIGFATYLSNEIVNVNDVDLGNIILKADAYNINEVSVTAIRKSIEFKGGNIIVNLENSPLAQGSNLYDLLMKLPGVIIDDKEITLNGKPGVMIMINGRLQRLSHQQLLNIFKSTSAANVEKIELLKNPPVKYDAAGTAGMINIITKKSKLKGFNGNIYADASQGFYARGNSGTSLNYSNSKIALFTSVDYTENYYQTVARFDRNFATDSFATEMVADNYLKDLEKGLYGKIAFDWNPDSKNTLGFRVDGGPGSYSSNGNGITNVYKDNFLGYHHMNADVITTDKWNVMNYNLNAEHRFDTVGTLLSFSSDYTQLDEIIKGDMGNYFRDIDDNAALPSNVYRNHNTTNTGVFAAKLDFTKALNDESSFDLGTKYSLANAINNYVFERQDNSNGAYTKDSLLSNNFSYYEQTLAAYANYRRTFKKLELESGLRVESTNIVGRNTEKNFEVKRSYTKLFPNISMTYQPSEKHNLQLNYNRRIDRPDFEDLNPFPFYRDQYQYSIGNPFIMPHYSNTYQLSHTYKDKLTNSISFMHIGNNMMWYNIQDDSSKIFYSSLKNSGYKNVYTYSFFYQDDFTKWWNFTANVLCYDVVVTGDLYNIPYRTEALTIYPTITNLFTIKKKTKLELTGFYRSAVNNGMVTVKPRWMISFALKRQFLNEKLSCSLGLMDVLYSGYFRTTSHLYNQNWNYFVRSDTRRITFSISYNFGNMQVEEREVSSSEDEKNRLGR